MLTLRSIGSLRAAMSAAVGLASVACSARHASLGGGDDDASSRDAAPPAPPGPPKFTCASPTPLVIDGVDTGYDRCAGGVTRRRAVVDCPTQIGAPGSNGAAGGKCASLDAGFDCHSDVDCISAKTPVAACIGLESEPAGVFSCGCEVGCVRDADCKAGEICVCGTPFGSCESAACNAGTCGAGAECVDYESDPGCPGHAFACETSVDTCLVDSDCDAEATCSIAYGANHRTCQRQACAVGRPFLVDGEARLAPVARRSEWRARGVAPVVHSLAPEVRARLGAEWSQTARMEHASIAAFARFTLQLLAVGAPPWLIADAQRAMADETVHAQLAFGLASAYAGADLGPGHLAVEESLGETDLRGLVATLFAEGCVGETIAALEAREALDHATDPVVRGVLQTIADDEKRHAELAWRTIAWVVSVTGSEALAWIDDAIADAVARCEWEAPYAVSARDEDMLVHGVLTDGLRQQLRRAALAEVVIPCASAVRALPTIAA
jgi:hypothetical protein